MTRHPLSPDLVGTTFAPVPVSWDDRDVMLYALGVGAGPDDELAFVYEGEGAKVLPTFAVIPGMAAMSGVTGSLDVDRKMILHGEQRVTLHRPIPIRGSARATGRIAEVWDKGSAAVVVIEGEAEDDDGPLFSTRAGIFIRNAGGFGGERGPSTSGRNVAPETAPDVVVRDRVRPEQAAIYRLSGDRNPLHIDPSFAVAAGFDRPFIHGLCTYGFVGRAVLSALCGGDPARFRSLEGRFADQVYPGDEIVTKAWIVGDGEAVIRAETATGTAVLTQAAATFSPR